MGRQTSCPPPASLVPTTKAIIDFPFADGAADQTPNPFLEIGVRVGVRVRTPPPNQSLRVCVRMPRLSIHRVNGRDLDGGTDSAKSEVRSLKCRDLFCPTLA